VHKIFVGNPEGKIALGRPRSRWEEDRREIKIESVD
jgi:hypothetical protein